MSLVVDHLGEFLGKSVDIVCSSSTEELTVGVYKSWRRIKKRILKDSSGWSWVKLSGRFWFKSVWLG